MSMPYYENELYPFGPDPQDFDWGKAELLQSPTEDLKKEYDRLVERLQELRDSEPPKKRRKMMMSRLWINQTHNLRDLLNEIAEELRSRENA